VNEELASLRKYGAKIVEVLVHAGYNVIFRPHPVSYDGVDRELITSIEKKYSGTNAFSLDCSKDYFESYAKADVLVTDLSGTGFTFSLAFLRPTIFFSVNREAEKGLVGIQFSDREKIGAVVHNMDDLIVNIDQLRNDDCSKYIASYRAQNIFNVENSTNYIVGAIDKILAGQRDNDWLVL
ncbi:MAG: CDP-glycerol glycerophosphotransferase family protein, partial [Paracoccaceae bacterium]